MSERSFDLIRNWYDEYGVNHHHIQSYNNLVSHGLRQIISSTPIHFTTSKGVEVQIRVDNIHVPRPYIFDEYRKRTIVTPHDARKKNLTYSSPVFMTLMETKTTESGQTTTYYDRIVLLHLPIMVRSEYCVLSRYSSEYNECMNDPGGYFIINGIDRVLVSQQRNNYNTVYVFEDKNSYRAEIRSMSEDTNHSVLVQAFISQDGMNISFNIPYIKNNVSLMILMTALDVSGDQLLEKLLRFKIDPKHHEYIRYMVQHMLRESQFLPDSDSAMEHIAKMGSKIDQDTNLIEYTRQIIDIELFPHLGVFSDRSGKIDLLIYMVYRLLMVHTRQLEPHDKDNLAHKRIENSGILIGELFKSLYRSSVAELENDYEKNTSLTDIFNKIDNTITKNIKYCFSTGKWGVQRNAYIRQGVSQVLNRLSYIATLSHLQRIVIPIGKEGKNFKIRQIHPSSFGYICMYETPEGQSCGIVMNMTLSTRTTEGYPFAFIRSILLRDPGIHVDHRPGDCIVFLNGIIIGYMSDPTQVVIRYKQLRQNNVIPRDVSISFDSIENECRIYCDKGRLIRPFLNMARYSEWSQSACTFSEALQQGFVEWLDPSEAQTIVVHMYPFECQKQFVPDKYCDRYCEIHPMLLLGACAGAIPFLDHNQSPRNVYESSMMKQAIGLFATNYQHRYDAVFHTLDYPQRSLVSTQTARLIGMHEMPAGINCIVAITTHEGWNAEDSVIINRSAIERGLFCSNAYHTYSFEDKTFKTESCKRICIPPVNIQKPEWNYYHLDSNGLVRKGAIVRRNDVIVGQVYHQVEYKDGERVENVTDCSELSEEEGIIDRVESIDTPNGNRLIKIVIRQVRIPEIGDKFANLNAQKGTCALIIPQEDMPFTAEGIVPDIMMNSHALPSRMTISMLLEMIVGKTCLFKGELGDATPFSESSINIAQRLEDVLVQNGYDRHGWEIMYNGQTGKPLRSKIFIGTSYYQKLKHMVTDKIHARSYGNVTSLTRQPLAGRSKDGGLRLGEIEVCFSLSRAKALASTLHKVRDFLEREYLGVWENIPSTKIKFCYQTLFRKGRVAGLMALGKVTTQNKQTIRYEASMSEQVYLRCLNDIVTRI
jgi:DNA-directed RNA polymerase II subunit RPB2